MELILFALWFFLPAGMANMAPVLANKIPGLRNWEAPLDFGASFRGRRIFGDNKRWRGLVFGVVVAILTLWLQVWAFNQYGWAQDISAGLDYSQLPVITLGLLFAIGALGGDAIESFLKRQRGIPAGQSWFPFDQLDYIVGGLLASSLVVRLTFEEYVVAVAVWFGVHIIVTYIGYVVGLRDAKI